MEDILQHWGPSVAIFAPLVGAALMMLIPRVEEELHKWVALLTSLFVFGLTIWIALIFDYDQSGTLQFPVEHKWIDVINSRYIIGLDGISLPLILLTALVVPACVVYSWNHFPEPRNPKAFLILILILETGMIGTFLAQDLILFFVFFEVVLLPMYFMIGVWGGERRLYAAIKFFLFTLFGSALMIVSFLALYFLAKDPSGNPLHTFSMIELSAATALASRTPRNWSCSAACSSDSASRCRCSRSTRGCLTPIPRRRRWAP